MRYVGSAGEELIIQTRVFEKASEAMRKHYEVNGYEDYELGSIRARGLMNQLVGNYTLCKKPDLHWKYSDTHSIWAKWIWAYRPIKWIMFKIYGIK